MDFIGHVDGLCQTKETYTLPPSPLEILQKAGSRTQGQIVVYFLFAFILTIGSLFVIPLMGYWWLYPALGILVPFLLNMVRGNLIVFWTKVIGEGFDKCLREYGNIENVLRALKNQSQITDKLVVVVISIWLTDISPILCLALFSAAGVPFGLKIAATATPVGFNYFVLVGGLVPGALLLLVAIELFRFLQRSNPENKNEQ